MNTVITDCFTNNFIIIEGRTSDGKFVEGLNCNGLSDCLNQLCLMSNKSNVDWSCMLNSSPGNMNTITYYNTHLIFSIMGVLFMLLILVILILISYSCFYKSKYYSLKEAQYRNINVIKTANFDDDDPVSLDK